MSNIKNTYVGPINEAIIFFLQNIKHYLRYDLKIKKIFNFSNFQISKIKIKVFQKIKSDLYILIRSTYVFFILF